MGYKSVYKDVMRSYEAARDATYDLYSARLAAVYKSFPKVETIDKSVAVLGSKLAKLALAADEKGLEMTKSEISALKEKKRQILNKGGVADDYFTDIYRCQSCLDTGFLPSTPGKLALRCTCLRQKMINEYYALSTIKDVLKEENFDTFDLRYYSTKDSVPEGISPQENIKRVYIESTNFVQNFGKEFKNLLFYGATGLGKTFVCNCIAKDLLDAGHAVLYVTAPKLFRLVEDLRFRRTDLEESDEMMDAVFDVDLLILDDLGAEVSTVITSAALFDIINGRLLARKPTIISTNLLPRELEDHYSERTVSRFLGYYIMHKFFGDDIRTKKKYGA